MFADDGRCLTYNIISRAEAGLTEPSTTQREEEDRAYRAWMDERAEKRKREAEERAKKLREGNHWVILARGNEFYFGRDEYSTMSQQEAIDAHVAYIKQDMASHLREINRQMDAVKRSKGQIAKIEALELWPDPTAEQWPMPEGEA